MPVQTYANLNQAGREELMSVDGIDSLVADRIIAYREQHGEFKSIEDLRNIPEISDSLFERIKNSVTVAGPASSSEESTGCRSTFRL